MSLFKGHYQNWQQTRLNGIKKYVGFDFFKDKTVHELGCGPGFFGHQALLNGAKDVICSDARDEYKTLVLNTSDKLKFQKVDCDGEIYIDPVDLIIHFGVLYHIKNVESHIQSLANLTKYIFLETEVCDSFDEKIILTREEGYDQSVYNIGSRPSPSFIEKQLDKAGFNFYLIKDPVLNSQFHVYNWDHKNDDSYRHGFRRFWICWKKDLESPIRS